MIASVERDRDRAEATQERENAAVVQHALDVLHDKIFPSFEKGVRNVFPDTWQHEVAKALAPRGQDLRPITNLKELDVRQVLKVLRRRWTVLENAGREAQTHVHELAEVANRLHHLNRFRRDAQPFSISDAYRAIDTVERLLAATDAQGSVELEEKRGDLLRSMAGAVNSPVKIYPPSAAFDPDFNLDLMEDLRRSRRYFFKSGSGKYVATRVKLAGHELTQLSLVILDPESAAVDIRAGDRLRTPAYAGMSREQCAQIIRDEIYVALIGLFACRSQCPIEVGFVNETSVLRVEFLDDAVYVSSLHTEPSKGNDWFEVDNPRTYKYPRDSQAHNDWELELSRGIDLSMRRIRFSRSDQDESLITHLEQIGANVAPDSLQQLREAASRAEDELSSNLRLHGILQHGPAHTTQKASAS